MNHAYEIYELGELSIDDLKIIDDAGRAGSWEGFKDTVLEVTRQPIKNEHWDDVIFALDRIVTAKIDFIRGFDSEDYEPWELV